MGKSKAKEVTPPGTVHVVKWSRKRTTRGIKGRWVTAERTKSSKSVQSSPTKSPTKQTPNEYLWQWTFRTQDYLNILLECEAPPPNRVCCLCDGDGTQKCQDCLAEPIFCTRCCQTQHSLLPFHRISQWNSDFFETTLTKLGVEIHLGHRGQKCPHHCCEWEDTDDGEGSTAPSVFGTPGIPEEGHIKRNQDFRAFHIGVPDTGNDLEDVFIKSRCRTVWPEPPEANIPMPGRCRMTVVDTSGIHVMSIRFCQCSDALTADKQLFEMGLFPASFTRPKTAFTFALLDDFIRDNLECGTSGMNYYSKLRQITSSMFPHLVPDRYRELLRVARQWCQLKLLKWNGFDHEQRNPNDGELALFCPACPQPGINMTLPNEEDTTTQWLYSRSLVMDGNFKAEHLHPTNPEDEVWLTDGKGFMVARARYWAHLAIAEDSTQRSECNNHRAVNQANTSRHKLEATGIGGCACARHGCFVPNSMKMNMDYALCNSLAHNTNGIGRALTFYNVNCQYNRHLIAQVENSTNLSIPSRIVITLGIGLWHVHGHQDKCFVWYASNFIPGAGRIDGEIMETLWATLNIISPAARGMSTPHRQECLNYQMNDCNFMKMIRMGMSLSRKYKEAKRGVAESSDAFKELNNSADLDLIQEWLVQESTAQACQIQDLSAMDIYDVQLKKARSRKTIELDLLRTSFRQLGERPQMGAATWLASGISIEEMQIALAMDIRRMGRHPTETQTLDIARRRIRLQHSIDEFMASAARYLGEEFDANDVISDMDTVFLDEMADDRKYSDTDSAGETSLGNGRPCAAFRPELVLIPLPSILGVERCDELGVAGLVAQETTLREGQANDALHAVRVHLADKSVLFQTSVRTAKSQVNTTRAWTQVHSVECVINFNSMIYKKCRSQLSNLGASELLQKYRELHKSDLKANSAVADPNARGQRNSTLPWFWSLDVQGDSVSNDWLNEFYRVHWLRTKALQDRWAEENNGFFVMFHLCAIVYPMGRIPPHDH
ncbi:uncharacterized protein HD556DRAFT_1432294 [Suillus plorans]|uniref:CxC2-like cysteine cluster KDZ transposase-associated domain-containing protein n=1 Tax=Suillus plorans TaxID=116603 RepID=A0A9P7ANQ5_9AGAM|nr:uncharacterized protein HD556DRAFT_1432294 [Suillus plorans]KAG1793247.1 hypothetical protein HD556DRAFT_1432294 [Suillus plorans]